MSWVSLDLDRASVSFPGHVLAYYGCVDCAPNESVRVEVEGSRAWVLGGSVRIPEPLVRILVDLVARKMVEGMFGGVEHESPDFVPEQLQAFAATGYVRQNRHEPQRRRKKKGRGV